MYNINYNWLNWYVSVIVVCLYPTTPVITLSYQQKMNQETIQTFSNYFSIGSAVFVTFFGLIGNSIVLYILSNKMFRDVPMFRYFIITTIFQMLQLIFVWMPELPIIDSNLTFYTTSSLNCKFLSYLTFAINEFTIWISVFNSIDRYVSIKYPNQFSFRKNFKFQIVILAVVFLLSLTLYSPYYYFYDVVFNSGNDNSTDLFAFCMVADPKASLWLDMLNLIFCALLPFLVMIISSSLIGYHLKFYRENLKKDIRLFKILISMDIFFLICYLPFCVTVLIGDLVTFDDLNSYLIVYIFFNISYFLIYFYGSFSFIVHFISNQQFRKIFKSMIGIKSKDQQYEKTHQADDDL